MLSVLLGKTVLHFGRQACLPPLWKGEELTLLSVKSSSAEALIGDTEKLKLTQIKSNLGF